MRIVTLTLSAAYDVHCHANKIESGRENFVTLTETNAGGKGINISRALNSYGIQNTAIVVLGEENSYEFSKRLEKDGLNFQTITVPGKIRQNITIHTDDGEETRISFGGCEATADILGKIESITDSILASGDILTFTGSIPDGVDIKEAREYVKRLEEKGIKVIVDCRSFSFSDIMDMKPFLIKPNEYEAQSYIGMSLDEESEARLAAEELRSFGIENVMITLGARGAVIATSEGSFFELAPNIKALSTIGAGDSSIAGFIYALSHGFDSKMTLRAAVAFGSASCLESGTNPPEKEYVLKLLENGSF